MNTQSALVLCDNAGNPNREFRVATVCGGSYASVDKVHVENLVTAVVDATGSRFGCNLRMHVFQPPYPDQSEAPGGYMEFWVESPSEPALMFAVEFSGKEHERLGFSNLSLAALQEAAANCDPSEYASVACFDELWLFACIVAERLEITKLYMSYGI